MRKARFDPGRVVVEVALKRHRLVCPHCGYSTRARKDTKLSTSVRPRSDASSVTQQAPTRDRDKDRFDYRADDRFHRGNPKKGSPSVNVAIHRALPWKTIMENAIASRSRGGAPRPSVVLEMVDGANE